MVMDVDIQFYCMPSSGSTTGNLLNYCIVVMNAVILNCCVICPRWNYVCVMCIICLLNVVCWSEMSSEIINIITQKKIYEKIVSWQKQHLSKSKLPHLTTVSLSLDNFI